MKKNTAKILIFLFATGLFIWPVFVLGAVNYERTPTGTEIKSPVNFYVSIDNFSDLLIPPSYEGPANNYWGLWINFPTENFMSNCVASTTLSANFIIDFPVGSEIVEIYASGEDTKDHCEDTYFSQNGYLLDYNNGEPIFTIIGGGILAIPTGAVGDVLIYPKTFWNDLWKIITLVIGLPIAFFLLNKLINLTTPKTK